MSTEPKQEQPMQYADRLDWADDNIDDDTGMPIPGATPCPSWDPKP